MKQFVRRQPQSAIMTIIDGYLEEQDIQLLYRRWKVEWPEPLGMKGGEKAITCEMVAQVPEDDFLKTMKTEGRTPYVQAKRIWGVAQANGER